MEKHTNRSGKDPGSYWDKEEDEIDGLDAAIIKKYGEDSLEKLRKKKAEIEAGFGNQIQHGIQAGLGSPHVIMDNLETTSNQEVDSNLNKPNIKAVNGGSSSPKEVVDCSNKRSSLEVSSMQKNGDSNVKDADVTSLVNGKELGFHGGNPNDMAGSSKGSGHANEGGGNTTNPNVAADEIKESWSSILGRHAVSKKNLPFYAPTIVEEFNDLKTIPIWVVMKKFPIELWDDEGFGRFASTIGTPMFVDKLTETMARTSYARKKKSGDKVWVQTRAMISIDVEEDEIGADKKEETIYEAVSNPTDGDNKQCDEKVAVEDEVEKLGDNEEWETPNKKHTARAATVVEC
ncbi:hypothetical protein FRX31_017436 [Thalictrum thalictroides]|uniref:DUF4283 domain-containing protein n=1 Tax=Thalictrum thalictroides TaxID=46969 RepID=A0A7J6W829_THATH|nr:hypothetical protein FRX31_017436 [Thalictrum thalictroides]